MARHREGPGPLLTAGAVSLSPRGEQRRPSPEGSAPGRDGAVVRGIRLDELVTVQDVARRLPAIAELRDFCRSLPMLDAILTPDRESRYYSFDATWAEGEEMASMRDGSGDEYSIVF